MALNAAEAAYERAERKKDDAKILAELKEMEAASRSSKRKADDAPAAAARPAKRDRHADGPEDAAAAAARRELPKPSPRVAGWAVRRVKLRHRISKQLKSPEEYLEEIDAVNTRVGSHPGADIHELFSVPAEVQSFTEVKHWLRDNDPELKPVHYESGKRWIVGLAEGSYGELATGPPGFACVVVDRLEPDYDIKAFISIMRCVANDDNHGHPIRIVLCDSPPAHVVNGDNPSGTLAHPRTPLTAYPRSDLTAVPLFQGTTRTRSCRARSGTRCRRSSRRSRRSGRASTSS